MFTRSLLFALCTGAWVTAAYAADAKPAAAPAAEAKPAAADAKPADVKPADAAAPAATPAPQSSDEAFDTRVKGLEEQVNDIKEKIFRTKARLLLLQETVVGGDIVSGARATIIHKNEMGSSFQLVSAAYALDGSPIYTKVDVNGDLSEKDQIEIFSGRIVPGAHQLTVKLEYKGHGFGPISYLEGYKIGLTTSYTFNAEGGKATVVEAIGYEKGGPFAEYKDKPGIKFETQVSKEAPKAQGPDEGKPADPAAPAKP